MRARPETPRLLVYTDAVTWGGAEECVGTLLAHLDERFDVSVVAVDGAILERLVRQRPGASGRLVPPFRGKRDLVSLRAHVRAFRAARPHLCHLNLRVPSSCQAGIVAAVLTTPFRIVAVEHLPLHSRSAFVRWSRRQAAHLYAAHVAVGERSARQVERELGLAPGSVRAVHNGVESADPGRDAVRGAGPVVGTIGRLVSQKGHEVLLAALAELPGVRGVIVGDGPARPALEQLAARLELGNRVELVGWSDDARSYLSAFDVFALPSHEEGFPLVVLEAMLARVPVVATDVGSVSEAIEHRRSGLLTPPGDATALAAAVRSLLDDDELRRRLAGAAYEAASASFTAAAMAARYEQLYDEVLR